MSAVVLDGRRARGDRTKRALLEATLDVVARDGVGAVTHRSVTRRAGVPATSAAYHYPSIRDLLEAALLWADQQNREALVAIAEAAEPISALARWLVEDYGQDRSRCLAEYELYLHAARVSALRPAAMQWVADLATFLGRWTTSELAIRLTCAYVDGMLIEAHVSGSWPSAADVEVSLRMLLAVDA
ncbi:MAG: TetR/AcrR family transcriptional regulator [Nocardioidaceae bacterium]